MNICLLFPAILNDLKTNFLRTNYKIPTLLVFGWNYFTWEDVVFFYNDDNSLKGGIIEIKIDEKYPDAIIQFIDSGEGIPDKIIENIFDSLFTKQKALVLVWQVVKIF